MKTHDHHQLFQERHVSQLPLGYSHGSIFQIQQIFIFHFFSYPNCQQPNQMEEHQRLFDIYQFLRVNLPQQDSDLKIRHNIIII